MMSKNKEPIMIKNKVIIVSLEKYRLTPKTINTLIFNCALKDYDIKRFKVFKHIIKFYLFNLYEEETKSIIIDCIKESLKPFKR